MFAGHSHGPTSHLVSGCPLCDAQKEARNRAIGHLTEALNLLAGIRPAHDDDARPTLRLNLGPIGVTGDDVHLCRSIDLTAKQAEVIADAVDSVNAYAGAEQPAPALTPAAVPGGGEDIASGEWTAAAVARRDTDFWDQVNDAFDEIDARTISGKVMNDRVASSMAVISALDDVLGDVRDPYADEDGDL